MMSDDMMTRIAWCAALLPRREGRSSSKKEPHQKLAMYGLRNGGPDEKGAADSVIRKGLFKLIALKATGLRAKKSDAERKKEEPIAGDPMAVRRRGVFGGGRITGRWAKLR